MRKQGVLDEKLDKDGFSEKAIRLRAVATTSRNGKTYPFGRRFILATRQDEALLEEFLGGNAGAITFPTAGFMPEENEVYSCRVRAKGRINLAFPAQRWKLRGKTWRPGLYRTSREIVLEKSDKDKGDDRPPVWIGQHPDTGQLVLGFNIKKAPEADGKIHIRPEDGYAMRPRHAQSWWALASAAYLKTLTEAAMDRYDEVAAATQVKKEKPDYSRAREFNVFGRRTIFEIYGHPRGNAKDINELSQNGWDWFSQSQGWLGTPLLLALHEDALPIDFTDEERLRAARIAIGIKKNAAEAIEWGRHWLLYWLGRLARRQRAGVSVRFSVPKPEGRPVRFDRPKPGDQELRPEKPLIELDTHELRGLLIKAVRNPELLSAPTFEDEEHARAQIQGKTETTAPKAGKGQVIKAIPSGDLVASAGEEPGNTIGERLAPSRSEAPPTRKPKTHFYGLCSVCEEHRIQTSKPELSGEVIPGAVCKKCAKNKGTKRKKK